MESVGSTVIGIIIVVVNVVIFLPLLCRDVVQLQTVWRASVRRLLSNCPKILICLSVTPPHRHQTTTKQQECDDCHDRNDNDEGLFVLDNTDDILEGRPFLALQRVVWGPTPWKSVTDALTETETRESTTKQTGYVLHHKCKSVTSHFGVPSALIESGT